MGDHLFSLIYVVPSAIAAGVPSPADDHCDEQVNLNEYLIHNAKTTFLVKIAVLLLSVCIISTLRCVDSFFPLV
jgi:hypothetical protein